MKHLVPSLSAALLLAGCGQSSPPGQASQDPANKVSRPKISLQGNWICIEDSTLRLSITAQELVATMGPVQLTAGYRVTGSTDTSQTLALDWAGQKETALILIQGDTIKFTDGDGKGSSTIGGTWRRR